MEYSRPTILLAGIALSILVIATGIFLMLPRGATGALLVIWGAIAALMTWKRHMPIDWRPLFVAEACITLAGGAIFLFSSDWQALGTCPAIIYCDVMAKKGGAHRPAEGVSITIATDSHTPIEGLTDPHGAWAVVIDVPYVRQYRVIGDRVKIKTDGISVSAFSGGRRTDIDISNDKNVQVFLEMAPGKIPALIVVPIVLDHPQSVLQAPNKN
ncbi:hypothetical protein A6X21_08505 [Planctopirus hydrillae]|uniref:Uncharacterized protein n=2 Tax=Planctopirus hydrillae TaxID=1841610 RepID=A0A1C3E8B8_9PLAN|nr:hypothetical protein A6X21_08505 [Planctopirus hydrillae]